MLRFLGGAGAALLLALASTSAPGPADAATTTTTDAAATSSATTEAVAALDRAAHLLSGGGAARGQGGDSRGPGSTSATAAGGVGGGDATFVLRDLARLRNALPADRRAEADRILARPTDGGGDEFGNGYDTVEQTPVCSAVVCVHYVLQSHDKDTVDPTDSDHDGVPDFVETTLATFTHVDKTYRAAGYRPPLSDGGRGGSDLPDVYLANIGNQGLYGYCTSDQRGSPSTTWAYCVVDNDFSRGEFPSHTPVENLQVTAAHEYFHAVQFGYDYNGDRWFMEATATWAEDEVYTTVNDNRQYLYDSPVSDPEEPMDQFVKDGTFHYGIWIFFRYLSERYPSAQGGMPTIVRDLWRRDDASRGGPDEYSMKAIATVLKRHHTTVADTFAHFARANRDPGRSYSEGKHYPSAPLNRRITLSSSNRSPRPVVTTLHHLSSATVRFQPNGSLRGAHRLRLGLDLGPTSRGSEALVTVQPKHGAPRVLRAHLDGRGDGVTTVDLTSSRTSWVEVTLADGGTHYRCGRHTRFSCGGTPLDDGQREQVSAQVL